ncbi:hypothetical protein AX16_009718 [Volvariella volvacea WC 439]|nr:hypothetical protein AX16_009718 [Volvariella volvacea WC 439]
MSTSTQQCTDGLVHDQSSTAIYFPNAEVVEVGRINHDQNTTVINIATMNVYASSQSARNRSFELLRQFVADFASYNSQIQSRNRNHEWADETRIEAIDQFEQWMNSPLQPYATASSFLVTGSAGTGKSALMRYYIDSATRKGNIVLHFFFCEEDEQRNTLKLVMTTFAHQLIVSNPEIGRMILDAIASDLTILTAAPIYQWETLFRRVLDQVHPTTIARIVLAFDALDTCTPQEQRQILRLVKTIALPLKVILSSRPQRDICEFFGGYTLSSLPSSPRIINLSGVHGPRDDMVIVIKNGLPNLEAPQLQAIMDLADGQLSIIHSYLQNPRSPHADIDKRYRASILKALRDGDQDLILLVLFHLIYINDCDELSINIIARFWNKETHQIRIALSHLYSVIDVPPNNDYHLRILNVSFESFLRLRANCQHLTRINQNLAYLAFLRCLGLAEKFSSSFPLEFPLSLYAKWIDIGPLMRPDFGVDFKLLKKRLRDFNFQRWKGSWLELSGCRFLPGSDAFCAWIKTFSKRSLRYKFVFDSQEERITIWRRPFQGFVHASSPS